MILNQLTLAAMLPVCNISTLGHAKQQDDKIGRNFIKWAIVLLGSFLIQM
jgi:hypothetical protein